MGALSEYVRLTSVCLSAAYIGPKSGTETSRKIEIGTEVAHVTRDSNTTFKVKRSKFNLQGAGHIVSAFCTACYCYDPRPHRAEALSDDARLTSVCHVHRA